MTQSIRMLIVIWLLAATVLSVYTLAAGQVEIIVVHSNQSKTLLWNPATHEEVRNVTADGNVILTVRPQVEK